MTEDWGTDRSRARTRLLWKRVGWGVAALALVSVAIPFVMGFIDGFTNSHAGRDIDIMYPHIDYAVAAGMAMLAAALLVRHLRHADEFERRAAVDALAVAGATALCTIPALTLAAEVWKLAAPGLAGWTAAVVAGTLAWSVRRVRG